MIEKEIKLGDILSESSHYKVKNILGSSVILEHFESKNVKIIFIISVILLIVILQK